MLVSPAWASAGAADKKPKLILQITVDQLRGDLPTRYYDRLGKGGLRYLLDKGAERAGAARGIDPVERGGARSALR